MACSARRVRRRSGEAGPIRAGSQAARLTRSSQYHLHPRSGGGQRETLPRSGTGRGADARQPIAQGGPDRDISDEARQEPIPILDTTPST